VLVGILKRGKDGCDPESYRIVGFDGNLDPIHLAYVVDRVLGVSLYTRVNDFTEGRASGNSKPGMAGLMSLVVREL
jgi:hypothetical protein